MTVSITHPYSLPGTTKITLPDCAVWVSGARQDRSLALLVTQHPVTDSLSFEPVELGIEGAESLIVALQIALAEARASTP